MCVCAHVSVCFKLQLPLALYQPLVQQAESLVQVFNMWFPEVTVVLSIFIGYIIIQNDNQRR